MRILPSDRIRRFWTAVAAVCLGVASLVWAQQAPQGQPAAPAGRGGQPGQLGATPEVPPPNASSDPLLRSFQFRSIGPATMMGRADDIGGFGKDPMMIYAGFANGGMWQLTVAGNHE